MSDDMTSSEFTMQIVQQLAFVGRYRIGGPTGLSIYLQLKPLWAHRFFMKIILGWEWIDEPEHQGD